MWLLCVPRIGSHIISWEISFEYFSRLGLVHDIHYSHRALESHILRRANLAQSPHLLCVVSLFLPTSLFLSLPSPIQKSGRQVQMGGILSAVSIPSRVRGRASASKEFGIFWCKEMCPVTKMLILFVGTRMSTWSFGTKRASIQTTLLEWTCWFGGGHMYVGLLHSVGATQRV